MVFELTHMEWLLAIFVEIPSERTIIINGVQNLNVVTGEFREGHPPNSVFTP